MFVVPRSTASPSGGGELAGRTAISSPPRMGRNTPAGVAQRRGEPSRHLVVDVGHRSCAACSGGLEPARIVYGLSRVGAARSTGIGEREVKQPPRARSRRFALVRSADRSVSTVTES